MQLGGGGGRDGIAKRGLEASVRRLHRAILRLGFIQGAMWAYEMAPIKDLQHWSDMDAYTSPEVREGEKYPWAESMKSPGLSIWMGPLSNLYVCRDSGSVTYRLQCIPLGITNIKLSGSTLRAAQNEALQLIYQKVEALLAALCEAESENGYHPNDESSTC